MCYVLASCFTSHLLFSFTFLTPTPLLYHIICGGWIALGRANVWKVDNPYDGSIVCEVPVLNQTDAARLIDRAATAQRQWRTTTVEQRVALVQR